MVTTTKAISIGVPLTRVWAALADFGNVRKWSPVVTNSYLTTKKLSGVGTWRHCDLFPRGEVEETIVRWQENIQLVIDVHPVGPIARQQMTIDLVGLHAEESETTVRVTIALDPTHGADDNTDAMRDTFRAILRETLAGLRHHLLTGETVTEITALAYDGLVD